MPIRDIGTLSTGPNWLQFGWVISGIPILEAAGALVGVGAEEVVATGLDAEDVTGTCWPVAAAGAAAGTPPFLW